MKNETHRISLYRLRPEKAIDVLTSAIVANGYEVEMQSVSDVLLLCRNRKCTPSWLSFVNPKLNANRPQPTSQSSSFIYMIRHGKTQYAITGGYGYTEIEKEIDEDFGIELACRLIDGHNDLKVLSQRVFKGTVRQLVRSVENYNPHIDKDNYYRVLSMLQGKGSFLGRKIGIVGRTSIALRVETKIDQVPAVLAEIERIEKLPPKIALPKSYSIIRDKATIALCEDSLFNEFSAYWNCSASRERLFVEFPDPVSQFKCAKFQLKFGHKSCLIDDFDLDSITPEMKAQIGLSTISNISEMKRVWVSGYDESNEIIEATSFFDNIVFETNISGYECIKMGKKWYKIEGTFVSQLDDFISRIKISKAVLPQWDRSVYNSEALHKKSIQTVKNSKNLPYK